MTAFPSPETRLGPLLVVGDVSTSRDFYRDILGATVTREMEGSFCQLELAGTLLFLVSGGGPTADKPDITFAPPGDPGTVSAELTFRVPDCQAAYDALIARGATFLSPPLAQDWGGEIRCFLRDPDGHLLEFSQLL
jgi:catechol 2,3-dioxygenase-like lactoylglutathione lyase family enzyme